MFLALWDLCTLFRRQCKPGVERPSLSKALNLQKHRLNSAGFENRFRGRADQAPHVDNVYGVMYPNKDNSDYTSDATRNDRIRFVAQSDYDVRRKVNGDFDIRIVATTGTAGINAK